MSQSDEQSKYTTCSCQHCGGHIRFELSRLKKGEPQTAECPHCHLETILFNPEANKNSQKTKAEQIMVQKHNLNEGTGAVTKFEHFVLQLTRFLTLAGAALLIAALVIIVLVFTVTFWPQMPERPEKIHSIGYEEIAAAIQPQPTASENVLPSGSEINTAEAIPEVVANFVANHPDSKLDVAGMSPEQRKAFLNNLATVIEKAKANRVSDSKLVQIVGVYADLWAVENAPKPNAEPPVSKRIIIREFCVQLAPELFIAITVLCLILVLFAIERNIRVIAERSASSGNPTKDADNSKQPHTS